MPSTYSIRILTPQGPAFEGEAVHALLPAEDGFVGVLANHAPYVASSPGGRLEIREPGGAEKKFTIGPGFFEVAHNQATFLTVSFAPRA